MIFSRSNTLNFRVWSSGNRFSTRTLVACLREGAERFGWKQAPRRDGRSLVGYGVAASTYPARRAPSQANARAEADGTFTVSLGAGIAMWL